MQTGVGVEYIAHQSVVVLHDLIEAVFTGQDAEVAYEQLMSHFSDDFKMVTTAGVKVSLVAVQTLFKKGMGLRPALNIGVSDVTTLSVAGQDAWLQYQETHTIADIVTKRLSVVRVKVVSDTDWQWVYLHETPISA